jgi:lysozyme
VPQRPRTKRRIALIAAAAAATAAATIAAFAFTPAEADTAPAEERGGLLGNDVSSHQEEVDWAAVAAAGGRFTIAKATEGTGYVNPYFGQQYGGAKGAGLYGGAYHFALPNESNGTDQANFFLDNASYAADGTTLPPALDIEYNPYGSDTCYGLAPADMVAWVGEFTATVRERTGRDALIYTNADWWNTCTGGAADFGGNPLWVADYNNPDPLLPNGWSTWTIHQWADGGSIPGDQNWFNGDEAALQAFAGG